MKECLGPAVVRAVPAARLLSHQLHHAALQRGGSR